MLVKDVQQPLRDDIRLLATLLGETLIGQEGAGLYAAVERVRAQARQARGRAGDEAWRTLAAEIAVMPLETAVPLARAFSQFLQLANIAEQHHRVRRGRVRQRD